MAPRRSQCLAEGTLMARFILRRLMASAVILVLLSFAVFTLLRVMPGDEVICSGFCTEDQIRALRAERGMDKPLFPVTVQLEAGHLWLLAVPLAGAAGYAIGRRKPARTMRA